MRISDWRLGVCSSDRLAHPQADRWVKTPVCPLALKPRFGDQLLGLREADVERRKRVNRDWRNTEVPVEQFGGRDGGAKQRGERTPSRYLFDLGSTKLGCRLDKRRFGAESAKRRFVAGVHHRLSHTDQ